MTIQRTLCYLLITLIISWLNPVHAFCQNADFVRPGATGIFIGLGKNVPNGLVTTSYRIERSGEDGSWKVIGEAKAPATFDEFLSKVEVNKSLFSGNAVPSHDRMEKLWTKAGKTGVFDSGDSWGLTIPVRMAFGLLFFDRDVKDKTRYKYRVTALDVTGGQLEQSVSEFVTWPLVPVFDAITLVAFEKSARVLSLKWKSVGKKPAADFRVFRFENEKPVMMNGKAVVYAKKDTTWYFYQDNSIDILGMKDLMCFLMPMDAYENMGRSTPVIQAGGTGFDRVYFTRTRAVKAPQSLGINLTWKISDISSVKNFEVYRSLDFTRGYKLITTLGPADTSFTDPGVTPDKVFYYYLQACGMLDFQKVVSNKFFDYGMDPGAPVTPAIYKSNGITKGIELCVLLNDINIAGIRVFRSDGLSDSLYALGDLVRNDSNTVVFRDTSNSLNGYHYYRFAVKSENTSHHLSELSNIVSVRPLKPTFPDAPGSFHAYLSGNNVKLFWDNGGDERKNIQGYKLSRRLETGKTNDIAISQDLPGSGSLLYSNYFTDSTADAGKTFTYNLAAVDIYNGISKNASTLTIAIPAEIPIPPSDLKAINTPDGVVLEWGPAIFEDLDMYRIYRYQRGNAPEVIKLVGKNIVTYTDKTAQPGQLYFYYLTTVDKKNQESVPCSEVGILR